MSRKQEGVRVSAFSLIELSIVILIIGILIAGVTQASRLIIQMKVSTAKTLTNSSPVSSMRNLVLWYDTVSDASFDDAEEEDGLSVTNWYDLNPTSSSKVKASSVGTARPTYKASCPISSLPCLRFDGSNDYMDTANVGATSTKATYFMAVMPVAIAPIGTYNSLIMTNGAWSSANNPAHFQIRDDFTFQFSTYDGAQNANSNVLSANKFYILCAVDDGAQVKVFHNGINDNTVSTTPVNKTLGILDIASYFDGSSRSRFLNAYVSEIIIFDRAIATEERKSIESYLTQKYTGKRT